MAIANVASTDTVETQRIRFNQAIKILNDVDGGTHPYSNLAIYAANTANNIANSAANIASNIVNNDPIFLGHVTDAANAAANGTTLTISTVANNAYAYANNAWVTANSFVANSTAIVANTLLSNSRTQNTLNAVATTYVNAFLANISFSAYFNETNAAILTANAGYAQANVARDTANVAFNRANTGTLEFTVGDGVNPIELGEKGRYFGYFNYNIRIDDWAFLGRQSGSLSAKLSQATFADFNEANTAWSEMANVSTLVVSGSPKGNGSASLFTANTLSAGSIMCLNVASVSALTQGTFIIRYTKT